MAFVGDDEIEGVDGDVADLVGILVDFLVANAEDGVPAEEVDGHALDGGDVHERVPG